MLEVYNKGASSVLKYIHNPVILLDFWLLALKVIFNLLKYLLKNRLKIKSGMIKYTFTNKIIHSL